MELLCASFFQLHFPQCKKHTLFILLFIRWIFANLHSHYLRQPFSTAERLLTPPPHETRVLCVRAFSQLIQAAGVNLPCQAEPPRALTHLLRRAITSAWCNAWKFPTRHVPNRDREKVRMWAVPDFRLRSDRVGAEPKHQRRWRSIKWFWPWE